MGIGQRISTVLALVGINVAFWVGAYLLIVDPGTTFVTPDGQMSPTLAGLIPWGIGVVAIWSVRMRRTSGLWLAAALAIAAAALFVFSIALALAGIAAFLGLAAAVRTVTSRDMRQR